jgi:hypothetical protein
MRLVTSKRVHVDCPETIRSKWSWDDVLDVHIMLDIIEKIEAKQSTPPAGK